MTARLAIRAGLFLAALISLLLASGVRALDTPPYRDYRSECSWSYLRLYGAHLTYDTSAIMPWWTSGVADWDYVMDPIMGFWYLSPPLEGQTHLRWEGEMPLPWLECGAGFYACWEVVECNGTELEEAAIYFDYNNYLSLGANERITASAHEWGHNLNLGHYRFDRGYCDIPHRVMGHPDHRNCPVDPSPAEAYAVAEFYDWGGVDTDGDEFVDSVEIYVGTDAWDDCPDGTWDDAWPPDINNDTQVGLLDLMEYFADPDTYPSDEGEPGYDYRLDLTADGSINLLDFMTVVLFLETQCT